MTRCTLRGSLLTLSLLLSGCASVPYLADLGKDASEVVDVSVGWSRGLALSLRATRLAQAGLGSTWGEWVGLRQGHLDHWVEERSEAGVSLLMMQELHRSGANRLIAIHTPLFGEPGYTSVPWEWNHLIDRGWFSVGLRANLLVVGVDLGVELAELADLVTGLVGIDLLADDVWKPSVETLLARLESADPARRARAADALRRRTGHTMGYVIDTAAVEPTPVQRRAARRWHDWWRYQQESGTREISAEPATD